jgi:methionyl aminopeptidase
MSQGAVPTFLGYNGYPASVCISVNDELIHGIPGKRVLRDGDIVCIDVGATKDGFVGDCAATFIVGDGTEAARKLVKLPPELYEGIKYAREGYRVSDISHAVQQYVEAHGFSVVREYVGHGVGAKMHEEPEVPNYGPGRSRPAACPRYDHRGGAHGQHGRRGDPGAGRRLDRRYAGRQAAAHYENTILITDGDPRS